MWWQQVLRTHARTHHSPAELEAAALVAAHHVVAALQHHNHAINSVGE